MKTNTGMDTKFQDKIDEYLLHGDSMAEEEKARFLEEVGQDKEKREQLEFSKNVRDAICSRAAKLETLAELKKRHEAETGHGHGEAAPRRVAKRTWLWTSGIAAAIVVAFLVVRPALIGDPSHSNGGTPTEQTRGDDDVFENAVPADTTANDSANAEKTYREEKNTTDE